MAMHDTRNRGHRFTTDHSALQPSILDVLDADTLAFDNESDGEITPYYVDLAGEFSIGRVSDWRSDDDVDFFPDSEPTGAVRVERPGTAQRRS